jgi:hypothetical protein
MKNQKRTILRKLLELVVLLEQIELFGLVVLRHCDALVVCDLTCDCRFFSFFSRAGRPAPGRLGQMLYGRQFRNHVQNRRTKLSTSMAMSAVVDPFRRLTLRAWREFFARAEFGVPQRDVLPQRISSNLVYFKARSGRVHHDFVTADSVQLSTHVPHTHAR